MCATGHYSSQIVMGRQRAVAGGATALVLVGKNMLKACEWGYSGL